MNLPDMMNNASRKAAADVLRQVWGDIGSEFVSAAAAAGERIDAEKILDEVLSNENPKKECEHRLRQRGLGFISRATLTSAMLFFECAPATEVRAFARAVLIDKKNL